jgi:hypothetical protein
VSAPNDAVVNDAAKDAPAVPAFTSPAHPPALWNDPPTNLSAQEADAPVAPVIAAAGQERPSNQSTGAEKA